MLNAPCMRNVGKQAERDKYNDYDPGKCAMNKQVRRICVSLMVLGVCHSVESAQRPNILYIMSDDHAAQAVGAYGSSLAHLNPTPNIDQLAAEGMVFDHAYCNNAICTPSRASIITGQYPQTNGVLDLDSKLDTAKQYLPIEMKKLGYTTGMIGKWHLHSEPIHFDFYKVLPGQGTYFDPQFQEKGQGVWPNNRVGSKGHSSDVITDLAIDYLSKLDRSKPFFLMQHYKAPHGKFEYAPRYASYLADVKIPEPASLYAQPKFGSIATRGKDDSLLHVIGSSVSARHPASNYVAEYVSTDQPNSKAATSQAYQTYLKDYLRCVKGVDDNLARLFDYLKQEGLWENTIIIYTGDQGFMLGAHDLKDKRWMYEESMQMPFIVHQPGGVQSGTRTDLLINNCDFAPTMIELGGGQAPDYMQGRSFAKTLAGQPETDWRQATYYRYWMHMIHHYVPAHFGIRTKDYKLIFYYGTNYRAPEEFQNFYWGKTYAGYIEMQTPVAWEFYDLKRDPQEMHNEYGNPEYAGLIKKLKADLAQQREQLNETDVAFPKIEAIVNAHWND